MPARLVLIIGVLLVAAIGLPFGAAEMENRDSFCASCHTEPESTYYARTLRPASAAGDLASYHAAEERTRCIDCHSGAGLAGRLQAQTLGARDAGAFILRIHRSPAITTRPLDDDSCLKCHGEILSDKEFDNHHHHLIPDWQQANPQVANTCVSCHTGHREDGTWAKPFLVADMVLPRCAACHADVAPGESIDLSEMGAGSARPTASPVAVATTAAPPPATPTAGPQVIARGEYLANAVLDCNGCHTPLRADGSYDLTRRLAGRLQQAAAGRLTYPNVTPHQTGIGAWTESDIIGALRNGVRPDGEPIRPGMPYRAYRQLSDADVRSVAAYLKSLSPVDNQLARSTGPVVTARLEPISTVPEPNRADRVRHGEYLVAVADCARCHTPPGPSAGLDSRRPLAGGRRFPGPNGPVYSANLTPDPSGIANTTEEQFVAALKKGERREDPSDKLLIMPTQAYQGLLDEDVRAMYAYLRSLAPIKYEQEP